MNEDEERAKKFKIAAHAGVYGPFRFRLRRLEDKTGVSGTGIIAEGVRFQDGTAVLRWTTAHRSTGVYRCMEDVVQIHGHDGATVVEWIDAEPTDAFERGVLNCIQDGCENCPFSSIGGLDARADPIVPKYIEPEDAAEYLRGYIAHARAEYGEDWATCTFGWAPAFVVGDQRS